MKETKIYADEFCTTFASTTEMLEFLAERAKQSKWIRKPTRMLKLVPLEKEAETIEEACEKELEGIVEDTEKNTQLVLKVNKDFYPVRDCAIHTILKRAGINGTGLKKLEKATYAKVVNYCLQVAKGDALIKVADGKVSAVHGGDDHDYCVLDMQTIFNMTSDYLKAHFKGSTYLEGSGSFDHSIVSAMWTLGGNQELLDTYHQALEDHGIEDKSLAPALRLTTSDVAVSGVNLYPMMLSQTSNRVINLGSPIKLSHDRGATLQDFRNNLDKIFSRYQEAVKGIVGLMDIDIQNPVNCLHLIMKELKINQKIRNEVVDLFVGQYGELLALGQSSIVPFLGRRGIKITHTLSRVKNREAGSKKKTKMILTPPKYPNSLRTIPLNKEAEFSLSCMMELYDKNRVFPDLILSTQNGVSPTIQNLANTLKKICKRAEIPEYNLHALRHTFATNLIRQTHNMGEIKEAAEIIGDNYEVIMRTYVHTDSERKVSLIDAMIA